MKTEFTAEIHVGIVYADAKRRDDEWRDLLDEMQIES